ncbi:MAG: hypothetical protein JWL82_589 [Parcubacteria group bacterium]|nr:hypothetical protein [Parcubacteria group bacterium]
MHGRAKSVEQRLFRIHLEATKNPILIQGLGKRYEDWESALEWLERHTEEYLAGTNPELTANEFEPLVRILNRHGLKKYRPQDFLDSGIAADAMAKVAILYRHGKALKKVALNRYTPAGHTYVAWKLKLLTDKQFRTAPPKFHRGGAWVVRKRRKKK